MRSLPRAAGKPLEPQVRTTLEQRFGHDFSRVRVHTDQAAAHSARVLGARAYTAGNDIVFGENQYGSAGQSLGLLAHELTHVVQQQRGGPSTAAEGGAKAALDSLAGGRPVTPEIAGGAQPGVYRQGDMETPPIPLDWSLLNRAFAPVPSLLHPPERQPFIPIPQFSQLQQPEPPKAELEKPLPPITVPVPQETAADRGKKAPERTPAPPAALQPLPTKAQADSADAPSRVGIPGTGQIDLGLRFSAPSASIRGIPGAPFAGDVAGARAEVTKQRLTGNKPPSLDMGELVKTTWSIFSTHIAADFAMKMASKLGSKPSTGGPQIDMIVNMPAGASNPSVRAKFASPGYQALGAVQLSVSYKF